MKGPLPLISAFTTPASSASQAAPDRAARLEAVYAAGHYLLSRERFADAAAAFRVMLRAAPADERGWLGLGHCHERISQPFVALELYGAGSVAAGVCGGASVRCLLARARVLSSLGRDAASTLDIAEAAARRAGSDELVELVDQERRRPS